MGPANPDAFFTALGQRDDWEDLTFGGALLLGYYTVLLHPNVSYRSGFFGPAERMMLAQGANIDLVPGGFRQFAPILRRYAPRVMTAQAAPPGPDGTVNLSLHLGATLEELQLAGADPDRLLVVEVNPKLPRTCSLGPEFINTLDLDLVDVMVEADGAPFVLPAPPPDEIDRAIAERARSFIGDGATLQIGIGAVPNMVAALLAAGTRRWLRCPQRDVHRRSDAAPPGGQGDQRFQERVQRGLDHHLRPGFVGALRVAGRQRRGGIRAGPGGQRPDRDRPEPLVRLGERGPQRRPLRPGGGGPHRRPQISGVGGHEDFVAGAELRLDDHSLICLRSTAVANGVTRSRIVPLLPEGSVVSTPRHHTGVVITEHGSAELSGLTVRERAAALAEIAHPDFRDELRRVGATLGRH